MHYIYLLRCSDQTIYCGYTTDIDRRVEEHNEGKIGAHYTKTRRPVELLYSEKFNSKREALQRELQIKKMTRQEKLKLIKI